MVYDKDMCKSKLGIMMCAFRADRPSEWQMDEFIHHAEDMNKEIDELTKQRDDLLSQRNSTGIAIDNAMRGMLPDKDSLLSRLQMIANVAVQHNELIEALDGMLSVSPIPTANDEYEAAFYAAINALVKATGCTK